MKYHVKKIFLQDAQEIISSYIVWYLTCIVNVVAHR